MKTLIELYDDRPIENVLASEVFRPERTVFLCAAEVARDTQIQQKLREYFVHCGLDTETVFLESSLYYSDKILRQLRSVVEKYEDCVIDITGGTDAALFACGQLCAQLDIPAFTYSRRRNCFYNIHNAEQLDDMPCKVMHDVEDCFLMAGGAMREGRVDNAILDRYIDGFEPFFQIYMKFRSQWRNIVEYFQQASQVEKGEPIPLHVETSRVLNRKKGGQLSVPEECMRMLEDLGFLSGVSYDGSSVSFSFGDRQIRSWLRDIGSVLELYVYKICLDAELFNDVRTSAVVDWEGDFRQDNVTNEIDVMAMRGILPFFISCKTCEASTEALNELAILRDRFGGHSAKAAIVTARYCSTATRHRATELGIDVIDLNDLKYGRVMERIKAIARPEK